MGSESSKSKSNSSKSDSNSSSNSGKNDKLEIMDSLKENDNTMIYRVWIVKKSISLKDLHIMCGAGAMIVGMAITGGISKAYSGKKDSLAALVPAFSAGIFNLLNNEQNVFEIKNESKYYFKHWAIILELNNGSFVNIQFGCNGFSLKEFNKTDVEGESLLNSIIETWGEKSHPFSFCFLGYANYEYKKLKKELEKIKKEESESFKDKGTVYYNLLHRNCQHFACDIEKILFGKIKIWHSFNYYLNEFYKNFFPNVDTNKLQTKYKDNLNKKKY